MTLDKRATTGIGLKTGLKAYSAPERAVQELHTRIARGLYRPGAVLPSERQLAQEIGISRPVIRAALRQLADQGIVTHSPNRRPSVAKALPGQMLVSQTGTLSGAPFPATATPALQAIAAVLPMEPTYQAAYDIQHGIQRALQRRQSSYRLVVFDLLAGAPPRGVTKLNPFNAESERQILENIANEGIAGVILWHLCGEETLPSVLALRERGVPVVFVDRYPIAEGAPPCDFVGVDNRMGAREAVNYLISLGHERIAHLTFAQDSPESQVISVKERYEGYREALWENGLTLDPELVGNGRMLLPRLEEARKAREAGESALVGSDAPTAVFAVNDASAHGFIERAAAHGIRVPEDISVIGFDDLDRHSHRSPMLSSVHVPFGSVGERAAELLLQRLSAPAWESSSVQHTLLSTRLVIRATCAERKEIAERSERDRERPLVRSFLSQDNDPGYGLTTTSNYSL